MLVLLPLAGFVFAFLAIRSWPGPSSPQADWRRSFLLACVLWGVSVTVSTEALSAFHFFERLPVAFLWTAAAALAAWLWLSRRGRPRGAEHSPQGEFPLDRLPLAGGMALLVLLVGATAWLAAPNSWDSMTYHLPRVSHWIQNKSVAHYPTHIPRQLFMTPWSEFALAQLEILSGSDRFANLVQWFAMIGSAIGVSLIARDLAGGATAQIAAAAIALSLPMGVLQGSSSQNDYVAGFWLICFVSSLTALARQKGRWRIGSLLAAAASLGLACLTKGTAYIYALPYVLLFGVLLAARWRGGFWRPALLVAAVVLVLNSGHFARNLRLFGSPIGPPAGLLNEGLSLSSVISNVSRNAALQLALPSDAWNGLLENGVVRLHAALGADPNDPRTTWRGSEFHVPAVSPGGTRPDSEETLYLLFHEGFAANPLHFLLILAALGGIAAGSGREQKDVLLYALLATAAFLLFCAALKWQPWHSRLHLPLLLLWSPAIALALCARPRAGGWISTLLVIAAVPWALANATRPLLGASNVVRASRLEQYFQNRPELLPLLLTAARAIPRAPCPVGLELGPDDGEYLISIALKAAGLPERPLPHVNVKNASRTARAAWGLPRPCAVLTLISGQQRGGVFVSRSGAIPRIIVTQ